MFRCLYRSFNDLLSRSFVRSGNRTRPSTTSSKPVDDRETESVVIVHGDEHSAGLLEGDPAGHQPARVDAPDGDKLHLEMLDRPL